MVVLLGLCCEALQGFMEVSMAPKAPRTWLTLHTEHTVQECSGIRRNVKQPSVSKSCTVARKGVLSAGEPSN